MRSSRVILSRAHLRHDIHRLLLLLHLLGRISGDGLRRLGVSHVLVRRHEWSSREEAGCIASVHVMHHVQRPRRVTCAVMLNTALPRAWVPRVHRSSSRRGHKRVVVLTRRHMIAAQQSDDNTADPLNSLVTDPVLRVALREPIAFFGGMFAGACCFLSHSLVSAR